MRSRRKVYTDRINDQLGPHKASARSGSVKRPRALAPCAPGNPGSLQVRRAMGGGASSHQDLHTSRRQESAAQLAAPH
jgi:hypothetical protein